MKGHITNRELAAYLADTMDAPARERAARHIASCGRCRAAHGRMVEAMSPLYRTCRADDRVRDRVLRTRDTLAREGAEGPSGGVVLRRLFNPRAVTAAVLGIAAVAVVALALVLAPPSGTGPALSVELADAGVTVDGRPVHRDAGIHEASALVLPDGTMARLAYGAGFSLTLSGPAVLTIDRLVSRESHGSIDIECTLEQGVLISAADSGGSVSYVYNTPGARVEPLGTHFLLQASGVSTLVVMKSGRVRVRPALDRESAVVSAGSRCIVEEKARVSAALAEDLGMIENPERLHAGPAARRLLPVIPLNKRELFERRSNIEKIKRKVRLRKIFTGMTDEGNRDRDGNIGRGDVLRNTIITKKNKTNTIDDKRAAVKKGKIRELKKTRRESGRPKRRLSR